MMARDEAQIAALASARELVIERIADAAARAGRDPADITLVAVSKTVPVERLVAAVAAGLTTLGENRVQEAEAKADAVAGATWHLIGPLQSNKVRRALEVFEAIESVDSVELARRIDRLASEVRLGERVPVLLQVNVDDDTAKAGLSSAAVEEQLGEILALEHLDVRGLMTIGRLVDRPEDARPTFAGLRDFAGRLRARHPSLGPDLSMGMSDDFEIAVEEGATVVRVGRALFGERH
jgi:pyridoxal phosphate enzyme (YggS family)